MPIYIKTGYWKISDEPLRGYLNLDALIKKVSPPSVSTIVKSATKSLTAGGGQVTISSSEFSASLNTAPKIIQVYDSDGNLIEGLSISYSLNGDVYDVIISGDIDGHTNAKINVI